MPSLFPGPAYKIITQRLVIRCYSPTDAQMLNDAVAASQEHLAPWMPWANGEIPSLQERITLLRRFRGNFDLGNDFVYGIFNAEETRVLGGTGLHTRAGTGAREIGYWIHKDFINQGLATEVSAALTKVAFEIDGVERVEIRCDPLNVRSAAIPRKLDYTHDGTIRHSHLSSATEFRDTMVWTILRSDYPTSPCAAAEIQAFDAYRRRIL
jgi:RimJ/RimL family protein N-acetyltransferase